MPTPPLSDIDVELLQQAQALTDAITLLDAWPALADLSEPLMQRRSEVMDDLTKSQQAKDW